MDRSPASFARAWPISGLPTSRSVWPKSGRRSKTLTCCGMNRPCGSRDGLVIQYDGQHHVKSRISRGPRRPSLLPMAGSTIRRNSFQLASPSHRIPESSAPCAGGASRLRSCVSRICRSVCIEMVTRTLQLPLSVCQSSNASSVPGGVSSLRPSRVQCKPSSPATDAMFVSCPTRNTALVLGPTAPSTGRRSTPCSSVRTMWNNRFEAQSWERAGVRSLSSECSVCRVMNSAVGVHPPCPIPPAIAWHALRVLSRKSSAKLDARESGSFASVLRSLLPAIR